VSRGNSNFILIVRVDERRHLIDALTKSCLFDWSKSVTTDSPIIIQNRFLKNMASFHHHIIKSSPTIGIVPSSTCVQSSLASITLVADIDISCFSDSGYGTFSTSTWHWSLDTYMRLSYGSSTTY